MKRLQGTTVSEILMQYRKQEAKAVALFARSLSDEAIAERTNLTPRMVSSLRFRAVGAMPKVSHRDAVWLLTRYAHDYGLQANPERNLFANGRRHIPDLVISYLESPLLVVEVKTSLTTDSQMKAALTQVRRYREVVGGGRAVVTAYTVPRDASTDDVDVISTFSLRRHMRRLGTGLKAA